MCLGVSVGPGAELSYAESRSVKAYFSSNSGFTDENIWNQYFLTYSAKLQDYKTRLQATSQVR